MHSIVLLSLVARCLETIEVCTYMVHVCFYVYCSDCGVCCVATIVKDGGF